MKRIPLVVAGSLLLLAACSSDSGSDDVADGGRQVTLAPGATDGADGGSTGAALVDPSVTEGCSILTQEQMASILGDAEGQWNSNATRPEELAECQWYSADGRSIAFQVFMQDLPEDNLPLDDEPVDVGNGGYFHEAGGIPFLDADIRGWLVAVTGVQGAVTREQVIALAELLDSVLIDRSSSSVGAGSGGSTDGGTDGAEDGLVTLTDMSVTINEPASIAGTMTLADLTQPASFSMCGGPWTLDSVGRIFTVMYEFGVFSDGVTSPAPVVGFSLEVQGDYTGPGVYIAQMRFATSSDEVNGVGSATVNPDQLTGSFTYSDAGGTITGSWACAAG